MDFNPDCDQQPAPSSSKGSGSLDAATFSGVRGEGHGYAIKIKSSAPQTGSGKWNVVSEYQGPDGRKHVSLEHQQPAQQPAPETSAAAETPAQAQISRIFKLREKHDSLQLASMLDAAQAELERVRQQLAERDKALEEHWGKIQQVKKQRDEALAELERVKQQLAQREATFVSVSKEWSNKYASAQAQNSRLLEALKQCRDSGQLRFDLESAASAAIAATEQT